MRILVTRPRPAAEETARQLAALGHTPIVAPLIGIAATGAALPDHAFDALAATSRNAIAAVSGARLPAAPLFAVGPRTGAAARDRGFADVRVSLGDADRLASDMLAGLPARARVLYLAGRPRTAGLEQRLRGAGHTVDIIELYEARAVDSLPPALVRPLEQGMIDAALHYSARSASAFCDLVRLAGLAPLAAALAHHCISAAAAAPLACIGARRVIVADQPRGAGLLATLPSAGPAAPDARS